MDDITQKISLDECSIILQNRLKKSDITAKSYKIVPLSNSIEGFLGQHYIVRIEYDDDDKQQNVGNFFMKVLNGSLQIINIITESIMAYERESFFYDYLLKEYQNYNIDISFAPLKYFSKRSLFVLEDLNERNFIQVPNSPVLDGAHCKLALRTLAKFHGAYILLETAKSKESGIPFTLKKEYRELLVDPITNQSNSIVNTWFNLTIEGIISAAKLLFENDSSCEIFLKKLEELSNVVVNLQDSIKSYKTVVLHGDLWKNNLLYKYFQDEPIENVLVDFQLIKLGPPAFDVLHVIFFNTRRKFRDAHLPEFLNYYYDSLSDYLGDEDLHSILPKSEYLEVCRNYQTTIKLLSIFDRCITLMPESMIDTEVSPDEGLQKFLLEDRSSLILEAFEKEENFRDVIEEDLNELKDLLLK